MGLLLVQTDKAQSWASKPDMGDRIWLSFASAGPTPSQACSAYSISASLCPFNFKSNGLVYTHIGLCSLTLKANNMACHLYYACHEEERNLLGA